MKKNNEHTKYFKIIYDNLYNSRNEVYLEFKNKLDEIRTIAMVKSPAGSISIEYNDCRYILCDYTNNYANTLLNAIKESLLKLNSNLNNEEWNQIENEVIGCGLSLVGEFDNKFKNHFRDMVDHQLLIETLQNNIRMHGHNSIGELKANINESYNTIQIQLAKKANRTAIISLAISIMSLVIAVVFSYLNFRFK